MIELLPKLFLIGSTGLFLFFLLLLIDYKHKWRVGVILFGVIILSVFANHFEFLSIFAFSASPLIIFLDHKRIGLKKCLIYVISSFLFIIFIYKFVIHFIPYFIIPVLVFGYVMVARKTPIASSMDETL